jgi:hypothetical protein
MVDIVELFKDVLTQMNDIDLYKKFDGSQKRMYVIDLCIKQFIKAEREEYIFLIEPMIDFIIMLSKSEMLITVNSVLKKTLKEKMSCCFQIGHKDQ